MSYYTIKYVIFQDFYNHSLFLFTYIFLYTSINTIYTIINTKIQAKYLYGNLAKSNIVATPVKEIISVINTIENVEINNFF